MKRILITISFILSTAVGHAQSQTFDLDQMFSFEELGQAITTAYLEKQGWKITDEGEESEPFPTEFRTLKLGSSAIKISWIRHNDHELAYFNFVDFGGNMPFYLSARAYIRDNDLQLNNSFKRQLKVNPDMSEDVQVYVKSLNANYHRVFEVSTIYMSGEYAGRRYQIAREHK